MGLRDRLNRIEGNAHATMGEAQELIALAKEVLAAVEDGVDIEIVRTGSLVDFAMGRSDTLPLKVKIKL